jgi:hypothetical protein
VVLPPWNSPKFVKPHTTFFSLDVVSEGALLLLGTKKTAKLVRFRGFYAVSDLFRSSSHGAMGSRTPDLFIANEALYQLSYGPFIAIAPIPGVGSTGLEPVTSPM